MNRTDSPAKQPKPFGINGPREPILSTTPAGDNTASYDAGFPPITMTLKSAGGLPPKGQDMNQILYELSALGRWASTGAKNTFDSAFATSIGGYPSGSYVLGDDLKTVYRCTTDGNTSNPNSVTTGWAKVAQDIADILALGTAAYKNVGTGSGQIPDMNSFTSGNTSAIKLPSGHYIQVGGGTTSSGAYSANYPVPFPNQCLALIPVIYASTGQRQFIVANNASRITANMNVVDTSGNGVNGAAVGYIAIGN